MSSPSLVSRPRVGSLGERPRSATSLPTSECKELEKYVKYLFYKATQVIVQSRQGGKSYTESKSNPKNQSWFCLAINDNTEITHEAKKAAAMINNITATGLGILGHPLCIEISLKTSEGDSMVLENWVLTWRDSSDPNIRLNNTVYNHMGLLLKSLLCVTRSTPAYRLSRRQGPETFVICYRVYAGDSATSQLGDGYQTSGVGQVVTNVGTLQLRVDYRTQMTITPSCSSSSENFYQTSSGSFNNNSQQQLGSQYGGTGSLPIQVKSDHFFSDLVPGDKCSTATDGGSGATNIQQSTGFNPQSLNRHRNMYGGPGFLGGDSEATQTSDESQEAMRIFASSPPDPTSPHTRRLAYGKPSSQLGNYSSNESLASGQAKFYRPRSGTNQSLGSTNEEDSEGRDHSKKESNDIKVGAFVSSSAVAKNLATLKSPLAETDDDINDPLLELFSLENKTADKASSEKPLNKPNPSDNEKNVEQETNIQPEKMSSPLFIERKLRSLAISDKTESDSCSAASPAKKIDFGAKNTDSGTSEQTKESLFKCLSENTRGPTDPFVLLDFKTPFSNKTTEDAKTDLGIFFKEVHKGRNLSNQATGVQEPSTSNNDRFPPASSPKLVMNPADYERRRNSSQSQLTPPKENLEGQLMYLNEKLSCFEQNLEVYDEMLKNMEVTSITSESESDVNY